MPPLTGHYEHPHTQAWARRVDAFDAYVVVAPEYNHAMTGALPAKERDRLPVRRVGRQAAGFVAYGAELKIASVRAEVNLTLEDDWGDYADPSTFAPSAGQRERSHRHARRPSVLGKRAQLRA